MGRINRVDLPNYIGDTEVLKRENFMVIGKGENASNRKVPGASRHTSTDTGDYYISGYRYYTTKDARKTFAFNNGKIYFISDGGVETELISVFSAAARPAWEQIRVSGSDILYFSEGINTGLYSHDGNISNVFTKENAVTLNFVGLLSHLDRLFGFEEDSEDLYFSKNLDPTNFTDSTDAGQITIGPRRGSKIVSIKVLYGTIYIFKTDSVWRLTGSTPSQFSVEEVLPFLGCPARDSIQNTDQGIIFLGSDFEFYFFGGTFGSLLMLTDKLRIGGDLTKNVLPLINRDKLSTVCSTFHNKIYRCSFVENGNNQNNLEYCFNTLNETDFITRDFNISCYIKLDRYPDKHELLTGRIDLGHLMKHNLGLNVDNGATGPYMRFRLQTKFMGTGEPRNARFKRAYFSVRVQGAEPITCRYLLDCRNTQSAGSTDEWPIRGETDSFLNLNQQDAISSRMNLDYGKSKGQNISFQIDHQGQDIDFELKSIEVETIVKTTGRKLSEKVAA